MRTLSRRLRTVRRIATHLVLAAVANEAAFLLRFDGRVPPWAQALQIAVLPALLLVRGTLFAPFGLYRGLWRYAGIWDLRNILISVGLSSLVLFTGTRVVPGFKAYPGSVLMVDALLLTVFAGGLRLIGRLHRARRLGGVSKKEDTACRTVLIF